MAQVKSRNDLARIASGIERGAREGFDTVATDIQRVSSDASPRKTGYLEKNHLNISYGSNRWTATISFVAFNGNFDYAHWTHEAEYNLGEGSRAKQGGNSKFTGHVPVGNKYLTRTVEQGRDSYLEHLRQKIQEGIG